MLAWFIIKHEIRGEKKYGNSTTGIDDLSNQVGEDDRAHASIYQPVNFYTAEMLMNQLEASDLQVSFLDVGCGKGRVLSIAAFYGFTNITGIDFAPALCNHAIQLAEETEEKYKRTEIVVECIDAREYEIEPGTSVIFMFNPFDDLVMKDFLEQVQKSLREYPRKIKILYANPQCRKLLLDAGFSELFHFKKLEYLEGSVFVNEA